MNFMRRIRIIENKSEIAAGTRGSSLGIDALKVAAWNQEDNYFKRYSSVTIKDQNHLLYEPVKSSSAIRIEGVVKVYEIISNEVKETLLKNEFPIVLSGDHASAGGVIAGVKMAYPDKRIGVIWIDAHGDLHSPYTSPSGNIHGMPLATALNIDNKESKIREVDETTLSYWNQLKNTGGIAPKILASDLVFFGVRDTEAPEEHLVKKLGIKNYSVEECRKRTFKECATEALESLKACDLLYLSFDVDSMDSDKVSEGTGTPVENGFFPKEAEALIKEFTSSQKLVCFEMVEINPTLDNKENFMAETAFKILKSTTESIEKTLIG
tara:strand:+ start:3665 stop:4636 length:972 start_codon:yes stop_codon:yes gene_type:complete